MSKGLQAFKDLLKQLFPRYDVDASFDDICNLNGNLSIIRNALENHQDLTEYTDTLQGDRDYWWNIAIKNENKLKALEIIKEKRVNVDWLLETDNVEEYNESLYVELTKEEYDLLKEVLL